MNTLLGWNQILKIWIFLHIAKDHDHLRDLQFLNDSY